MIIDVINVMTKLQYTYILLNKNRLINYYVSKNVVCIDLYLVPLVYGCMRRLCT